MRGHYSRRELVLLSPPHKHDEEKDGETHLEEIYYFETQVAVGSGAPADADAIGYQRVYASDERPIDVSAEVRTGDVVLVPPYGWHGPPPWQHRATTCTT